MDQDRDLLISTINKTITQVKNIKEEMKKNKVHLDEIQDLRNKLNALEIALSPRKSWFSEKIKLLDTLLKELLVIRFKIISGSVDEMFNSIDKNLIDGMKLNRINNEHGELILKDEKIGSIEVKGDSDHELRIKAEVLGISDEFKVDDPNRMFSVISFINTKYNYYSTTEKN